MSKSAFARTCHAIT